MVASSPLTLALLGHNNPYGATNQDPEMAAASRRSRLGEALAGASLEGTPAYPMQALGRLAQAIVGSIMLERGYGDLEGLANRRADDTRDAMEFMRGSATPAPQSSVPAPLPPSPKPSTMESPAPFVAKNLPAGISPDEDLIVRTTYGEARDQPPEGQRAVASVIRNRIANAGGSVPDVVFARNQFEPWNNPKTRAMLENLDPASSEYQSILANIRASQDDPTGGATHFFSPKAQAALGREAPSWASGEPSAVIGGHNFYKLGYSPPASKGVQLADAGNVATDATSGSAPAAVDPYNSPQIHSALDTIQRAQSVLTDPRYRYNKDAHAAANAVIEQAKLQLQMAMHTADRQDSERARLDARAEAERVRQEARAEAQRVRDEAKASAIPHTITMQDPDSKGIGIYEMTPQGPGKRLGNAPKQPGEGSGPFAGTGMEAQVSNTLLGIGPKIADGTATQAERNQYALAYQHQLNGQLQSVPDPTDPSKVILARIPGIIPPQFPKPDFMPPAGGAAAPSGGAPSAAPAPPSAAAPPSSAPPPSGGDTGQGAPVPVPGTSRSPTEQKLTEDERKAAGFALRMRESSDEINKLEGKGVHTGNFWQSNFSGLPGGNYLTTPDFQVYQQQAQDWVRAKLRRESGAVIGEQEMADEIKTYFPQPGDSPEKIAAKRRSRDRALVGMEEGAGRAKIDSSKIPGEGKTAIPPPPPGYRMVE